MPGTVISVDVAVGDMVAAGQACAVVEAMKMQNALTVSRDGKVKVILFLSSSEQSHIENDSCLRFNIKNFRLFMSRLAIRSPMKISFLSLNNF